LVKTGKLKYLALVLALLASVSGALWFAPSEALAAQVTFDATIDQNEVVQDDNLVLTLTVTSDAEVNDSEPRLPSLEGFELMNKWSQTQAQSIFENGKFKFQRRNIYKYTLQPQKPGNLTIGPAEVSVNGQSLTSKPITVKVQPPGTAIAGRPQQQKQQGQPDDEEERVIDPFSDEEDLFTQLLRRRGFIPNQRGGAKTQPQNDREAFFVTVEVDKAKAYVGEQIVVSWHLYTRELAPLHPRQPAVV
jgi:hypothetical protein